jgi:excisionase family DNA binding protein
VTALDDDRLLTADDVAEILNVKTSWVEEHARQRHIRCVMLGRYRRFRREDVDEFIERCLTGEVETRRKIRAA